MKIIDENESKRSTRAGGTSDRGKSDAIDVSALSKTSSESVNVKLNNTDDSASIIKRMVLELAETREQLHAMTAKLEDADRRSRCAPSVGADDKCNNSPMLSTYLDDCEKYSSAVEPQRGTETKAQNWHAELISALNGVGLKTDKLKPFDGNPRDYLKFVKQFTYIVESRIVDSGSRLTELISCCRGNARDAVEDCVLLPPDEGYAEARRILQELFGKPFQVAKAIISELISEAKRLSGSPSNLSSLEIKMKTCARTLTEIGRKRELDSEQVMKEIVRTFPLDMQRRWAVKASKIFNTRDDPTFEDLQLFVGKQAIIGSTVYALIAEESAQKMKAHVNMRSERTTREPHTIFPMAVSMVKCRLCLEPHPLEDCSRFRDMSVTDRWGVARRIGACFNCLNYWHISSRCTKKVRCTESGCSSKHHGLLHPATVTQPDGNQGLKPATCATASNLHGSVQLGVLAVKIETPNGLVNATAFLDSGSDTTLVNHEFVKRHNLFDAKSNACVTTVSGSVSRLGLKGPLRLHAMNGEDTLEIDEAHSINQIPVKSVTSIQAEAKQWPHLRDIPFIDPTETEVTILIGCDVPAAHWVLEQKVNQRRQPFASKCLLGWVLFGPTHRSSRVRRTLVTQMVHEDSSLEEQLHRLYDAEFGDTSAVSLEQSKTDRYARSLVEKGIRIVDGRFEVPIPWKPNRNIPYDNLSSATKRLELLQRRLKRDPDLERKYKSLLQGYIDKGYLEPALGNGIHGRTWYMPHHPVINPKKPEKVRMVYDCAAKHRDYCLNDFVLTGEDLTSPLIDVLMRFRKFPVAVSADVEDMFLRVRVPDTDRDALRILWWPRDNEIKPQCYRMTVHPFGVTSSPFCANFALRQTANQFGSNYPPRVSRAVTENFYVDDCLASLPDVNTASEFILALSNMLAEGGFRLTKWISNNLSVLSNVAPNERAAKIKVLDGQALPVQRTLGIQWDAEADEFVFEFQDLTTPQTRRGLLSMVSGLYDPLGFAAPWLLPGKILLQTLCKRKMDWDEPLPQDLTTRLTSWLSGLRSLHDIRIPRWMGQSQPGSAELHVFGDASEDGYGAVAYVRFLTDNSFKSTLLFAKARVSPIKAVTLPRLELTAAVLGIRLLQIISRAAIYEFTRIVLWTDSMIVLHYIRDDTTRFSTFVANRLATIHDNSNPEQWRYVPSELNPADRVSRGVKGHNEIDKWLRGPQFLCMDESHWPAIVISNASEDQIERKTMKMTVHFISQDLWSKLWSRYSRWSSIVRAVAWLLRFKAYIMLKKGSRSRTPLIAGALRIQELQHAEHEILQATQRACFNDDIIALKENKNVSRNSSLKKLSPVFESGLLRVNSRLSLSDVSKHVRFPIILPARHEITELLIRHYHMMEGHCGIAQVLASLRRKFWIIRGTTTVKKLLKQCVICQRLNALPGNQMMAPLPLFRVQSGWYPFQHVGIDYFGPLEVRRARSTEKRYGCLFTCMQSRAVHLELVHTLSTDSFIMALLRFIGRRGIPKTFHSDNGSNFVGAHRELSEWIESLDQEVITRRLSLKDVQWHFNPPYASHRGGVWERVIRSARKILNAICVQQVISDETLSTTLVEVERILNDRPIVPVTPSDPCSIALTPNDLLLLRSDGGVEFKECFLERYRSRWKQANYLASVFWKRWSAEYLTTLMLRQKWLSRQRNIQTGDVVIIINESRKRRTWPLGVVVDTHAEEDGLVRTVQVRTKEGIVIRDIRHLCLIEGIEIPDRESK